MIPLSDVNYRHRFPYVNLALIALNVLVYIYQVTLDGSLTLGNESRALVGFFREWAVIPLEYTQGVSIPPDPPFTYMTLFSAMFMHGSLLHIGSNMLYLWVFGDNVESNMGHFKYLVFYLLSGVLASGAHILFNAASPVPSLGASGAIAGVLAAYLVLFPRAQVRTLVIFFFITFIYVPAVLLIGVWIGLQFLQGLRDLGTTPTGGGVAVWAHIGGFVAGLLLVWVFRGPNRPYQRTDNRPPPPPYTGYSR